MTEARLTKAKGGLIPAERGWFVVNAVEARWKDTGPFGLYCPFEGKLPFLQLGINISVLQPGQSLGRYHLEPGHEEHFLVLDGECILVVEEQERRLVRWDFFHSPPGVAHMIVGSGEGPATVLSVGTRGNGKGVARGITYPVSEVAARHGVSVERETNSPVEAYADVPRSKSVPYGGWLA
ncbi:MAG: cupin domain-containing protein [Gaiellaceae bacterium]